MEAEAMEFWGDSPITGTKIAEVVKQLQGDWALGEDEIFPEFLMALDDAGLARLAYLCSSAWRSGTVPLA